jgi:nicotinamide-nucleotide amidase
MPAEPAACRAGIVVTGTEVLSAIISDRNGPWLSQELTKLGIDVMQILVVGDRPQDMRQALESQAAAGADIIVTSGGLGPTADDLTAEVVGGFSGREMVLDEPLEERIWAILERFRARWGNIDETALRRSNSKQAIVPVGATVLEPVGTAPGLVVPPGDGAPEGRPTVVVLPGPPRELQPMWEAATQTEAFRSAAKAATEYRTGVLRMFGIPESEIASTLRILEADGVPLDDLEITTCLRRGEIEVATRYEPAAADAYDAFVRGIQGRHADTLYSLDGTTVDDQLAGLLAAGPTTVATAESCTGGLLAARLTERPGSSAYMLGGVVAYSNEAKVALVGVPEGLIAEHGAVSPEVAVALASGAVERFGAGLGVGITGVAGPDGGTDEKPVGFVCVCVMAADGRQLLRAVHLPGDRVMVRDRAATVGMHMLRRLLLGEADDPDRTEVQQGLSGTTDGARS